MQPFTRRVITIIQSIPAGKVMTYGQIAAHAGSPTGARQVVRILHAMSASYQLPWHRVINIRGEIALQDTEAAFQQRILLEEEGIHVQMNGTIDLGRYLDHVPSHSDEEIELDSSDKKSFE